MSNEQDRGTLPAGVVPSSDPDLAEQAQPGHGVPTQDPDASAQVRIDPVLAEEEHKTVYMGGGVMAGAAAGAAVGTAVAGPLGTFVGTLGGAVVGALGGAAVGTLNPTTEEDDDARRDASATTGSDGRPLPP